MSPNDILVPNFQLDSLASAKSPLANVNILIQKIRAYHKEINKILEQTFLTDWRRFRSGQQRLTKSKKGAIPNEGDLVHIRADNLCYPS